MGTQVWILIKRNKLLISVPVCLLNDVLLKSLFLFSSLPGFTWSNRACWAERCSGVYTSSSRLMCTWLQLTTLSLWHSSCLSGLWLLLLGYLQCLIFYKELKMKFGLFLTFLSTYLSFKVKWFDLDSIRGIFTTTACLFFRLPLVFWFSLFLFFESTETQPWQICCWQLPEP